MLGFQLADRSALAQELDAAIEVQERLTLAYEAQAADVAAVQADVHQLSAVYANNVALLDAREDFVDAIAASRSALAGAKGKVDTGDERDDILDLQAVVLRERADVAVVTDATADVETVTSDVNEAVEEYDREQERMAAERAAAAAAAGGGGWSGGWSGGSGSASAASSGGGTASTAGGYARVRAALNAVGGGGVPLEQFAGACGGGWAAACASSSGVIRFTPAVATWSDGRLYWAMAHELAHIHQFRVWGPLMRSSGYASLFGGNIEHLANCMAAARGYGSGNVSCSGAQIQFAGAIWYGSVPA
ncbi:hypothetical protein GCM10009796_20570 [Microbacterium koreense]